VFPCVWITASLNSNKTANINVKTSVYTNVNGNIHVSKIAKIIKGAITQQHVDILVTGRRLILSFIMIFAVFGA